MYELSVSSRAFRQAANLLKVARQLEAVAWNTLGTWPADDYIELGEEVDRIEESLRRRALKQQARGL